MRTISDNEFINILKQSETFILQEAFSKVKNAKLLATFPETKSLIMESVDKKFYYATYSVDSDYVSFENMEEMKVKDDKNIDLLKESVNQLFEGKYEDQVKKLAKSIRGFITETVTPYNRIKNTLDSLLKEKSPVAKISSGKKLRINNLKKAKEVISTLNENEFFKKFITEFENTNKTPLIYEKFDFVKGCGKIFRNKKVIDKNTTPQVAKYTTIGFKKSSLIAKKLWKDKDFRARLQEALDNSSKLPVFLERYKNITLLAESELEEMLNKTIMAISGTKGLLDKMKVLEEGISKNKGSMLTWSLLTEAPEDADASRNDATTAGDLPPEATDVSGEDEMQDAAQDMGAAPEEDQSAEIPTDDQLEPQAEKEMSIISALLTVIENIFWNGNQENNELANLIKELRDMRESGNFTEDRLAEIFTDLFDITQQVASNTEQESPAGEEGEVVPEEGAEEVTEPGAEAPAGEELPAPETNETTPLDNY